MGRGSKVWENKGEETKKKGRKYGKAELRREGKRNEGYIITGLDETKNGE
jgi:hypothetical protein